METDVSLPFIANGPSGPVHLDVSIERDELEDLVGELIERLAIPCNACMDDAKVSKEELDAVLLVGGMTRMPRVQSRVEEILESLQKQELILTKLLRLVPLYKHLF